MFMHEMPGVGSDTIRTSSYTIYVDLPDDTTRLLLVHGYTGAFDVVTRAVAAYVRSLEASPTPKPLYGQWSKDEILPEVAVAPSDATVERLLKRGYLTTKSDEVYRR